MKSEMTRTMVVDGWNLVVGQDDEPRVRDVDLARRLGFKEPRGIRRLVQRLFPEGEVQRVTVTRCSPGDPDGIRDTVTRCPPGDPDEAQRATVTRCPPRGGTPSRMFLLTEAQALKVTAKSDTAIAGAILDDVIRVFIAARRGLLAQSSQVLPLEVVHGPLVGDVPNLRVAISALCAMAARSSGHSVRQVHGFVRRTYRLPGIHHVAVLLWPAVEATLMALALGKIRLSAAPRKLLPPDRRQLNMWGPS